MVVTIWTELPRRQVTRNEFFRRGEESFGGEDFHRFFGQPPGFDRDRSGERNEDQDEQERTPLAATGTGFDDDGLILTNNHVVENATSIQIQPREPKRGAPRPEKTGAWRALQAA